MKCSATQALLDTLCAEAGFCLPSVEQARLVASPPESVEAFAAAVFVAEGLDPALADKHLLRQVEALITKHFERVKSGGAA